VTWRVDCLGIEFADLEALTVSEQVIEIAAIGFQVGGVEDRSENSLHVLDVLANSIFPRQIRADRPIAETRGTHPSPENVCVRRR
jgi:hypothetical protein